MRKRNSITDEYKLRVDNKETGEKLAKSLELNHFRVRRYYSRYWLVTDGAGALLMFQNGLKPQNTTKHSLGYGGGYVKYRYSKVEEKQEQKITKISTNTRRKINVKELQG